MSQNTEMPPSPTSTITCSNCHSAMPSELRFCRNCGFRLGLGYGDQNQQLAQSTSAPLTVPTKRRRRSGMTWVFIGLLVFFVGAAAFTAIVNPVRNQVALVKNPVIKAYVGIDGWDTTDKGVTFGSVDAPGGPADKAGLVGGDIITKFDGHEIRDEDQMDELMTRTPIGKTVDVEYVRDGEKKTTKLTTISQEEFRRLTREFDRRPEGRGVFGYEDGDSERVPVPGTNIHGVKLNTILNSRPADLAGIKEGDIVIEFDGVPIRTTDEFLRRVRRALPYSTVKVVVMRGEEKLEIPVKIGRS
ncbi:MAG: PDZ domain-containing protein [Acidobacteria bacterium]|nr:PDZ domain-containing protein [Acidobacteriota bacterium]MCA1627387.1 PDZ domain-containing protein [Acidobacteriota bacterium]